MPSAGGAPSVEFPSSLVVRELFQCRFAPRESRPEACWRKGDVAPHRFEPGRLVAGVSKSPACLERDKATEPCVYVDFIFRALRVYALNAVDEGQDNARDTDSSTQRSAWNAGVRSFSPCVPYFVFAASSTGKCCGPRSVLLENPHAAARLFYSPRGNKIVFTST